MQLRSSAADRFKEAEEKREREEGGDTVCQSINKSSEVNILIPSHDYTNTVMVVNSLHLRFLELPLELTSTIGL